MMRTLHRPIVGRRGLAYQVSRIGRTWESFFQPAHKIVLKVPATTSNLGPGFDSFGLALDMGNRLTVERAEKFSLVVHGEGGEAGGVIAHDAQNLIVRSFAKIMTMFGSGRDALPFGELPPYRFECHNMVPAQRGLGSSSSANVLGMAAGLAMCGKELYSPTVKKQLLQLTADEEGHADNISAAIYGGFQVNFRAGGGPNGSAQWITQRVQMPHGLHCVLFIPDKPLERDRARAAMPDHYTKADTVHNIGRAAMLVNCFSTGQFDALRFAMEDRVHQPYRGRFYPFQPIIDAALSAGAHGAFLSSQGPSVVAICGGSAASGRDVGSDTMSQFLAEAVSGAMLSEAHRRGFPGEVHVAMPSEEGLVSSGFAADGTPMWGAEWQEAQKEAMWSGDAMTAM